MSDEEKTLTDTEHKQKVEDIVKTRFKKNNQEREEMLAKQQELENQLQQLKDANSQSQQQQQDQVNPQGQQQQNNGNGQDINDAVVKAFAQQKEQDVAQNLHKKEQEQYEKRLNNVMTIIKKGIQDDPEFKELDSANGHLMPNEYVYEIINSLGEEGLPALKAALKDNDVSESMLKNKDVGKLVAWASKYNKQPDIKKDTFNEIPDISGQSNSEEDNIASLVRNSTF